MINCPACDVEPGALHRDGCAIMGLENTGGSWFGAEGCWPLFVNAQFVVRDDGKLACEVHPDCRGFMLCRVTEESDSVHRIEIDHPQ